MEVANLSPLFLMLLTTVTSQQTTLCVWNSIHEWDHLNGEYIYDGKWDTGEGNYSYWKRSSPSCEDTTQYIFAAWHSVDKLHYWMIYPSLQTETQNDFPDCGNDFKLNQRFPVDPTQCQNGWTVWSSDTSFTDIPLTVEEGHCPSLPCARIQITGSGDSHCDHIFTKYLPTTDNTYVYIYNDTSTYLFFNQYTFKWYCSAVLQPNICNRVRPFNLSSKNDGWKDAILGQPFQLTMSNDNNSTFDCMDTAQPTQNPIATIPPITRKQDIDCGRHGISNNGTCEIECDLEDPEIPNLYCRDVDLCVIHCTQSRCLRNTQIRAENATNVRLVSTAQGCVRNADMYLPNIGNASIVGDTLGASRHVLNQFYIQSGTATDHISIECNGGFNSGLSKECDGIYLNAASAQFVRIDIHHAEYVGDASVAAVVQCPTDSSLSPSCVINATAAVSTSFLEIFAKQGMPQDVIFYSDGAGMYDGTTITCLWGVSTMQNDHTFIGTPCFIQETTIDPTTQPPEHLDTTTMLPSVYVFTVAPSHVSTTNTLGAGTAEHEGVAVSGKQDHSWIAVLVVFAFFIVLFLCMGALRYYKSNAKPTQDIGIRKPEAMPNKSRLQGPRVIRVLSSSANTMVSESGAVPPQSPVSITQEPQTSERVLVATWLETMVGLGQYSELFMRNGYDSMKIIATIKDKTELLDIGITMKGHQTLIMSEVENLRQQNMEIGDTDVRKEKQIHIEANTQKPVYIDDESEGSHHEESSTFSVDNVKQNVTDGVDGKANNIDFGDTSSDEEDGNEEHKHEAANAEQEQKQVIRIQSVVHVTAEFSSSESSSGSSLFVVVKKVTPSAGEI